MLLVKGKPVSVPARSSNTYLVMKGTTFLTASLTLLPSDIVLPQPQNVALSPDLSPCPAHFLPCIRWSPAFIYSLTNRLLQSSGCEPPMGVYVSKGHPPESYCTIVLTLYYTTVLTLYYATVLTLYYTTVPTLYYTTVLTLYYTTVLTLYTTLMCYINHIIIDNCANTVSLYITVLTPCHYCQCANTISLQITVLTLYHYRLPC